MRPVPTLAFLVILGFGCSKPNQEAKLLGEWIGDPPVVAQLKKDPQLAQYADTFKDEYKMELKENHTYKIHCWALKEGTWKRSGRFIRFEETSSYSEMPEAFSALFNFDDDSTPGSHKYSGVLSPSDTTITLVMGKLGDIAFHR